MARPVSILRLIALNLVAAILTLAPAAHATPPDQTWISGLSDNARVEIVKGLKLGEEVALEDPTLPADKKKDESDD